MALGTLADAPRFAPEAGLSITKRIETKTDISLDDMTVSVNGQEMDASMMSMEMDTSMQQVVTVTDTYVSVSDGRPTKLERSFDELSSKTNVSMSHAMMGDQDSDMDGSSELEGETVLFSWDDDEGEYSVAFAGDSDGDDELLEGLAEDLDMRALLPDGDVSEDDSWPVEPYALRSVFAPGGSVKIEPDDTEGGPMGMGGAPTPSLNEMLGELEGEVTATYRGTRDEDGVTVAVIEIEADVSAANDLTDYMEGMMDGMDTGGMEIEMEIDSFDVEFMFEGQGELLWNVESGVLYSLTMSGETSQIVDSAMNMAMGGMEQAMEQSMTMTGSQTTTITTEE